MENLQVLSTQLQSFSEEQEHIDERIELGFKIMEQFCNQEVKTSADKISCVRAAFNISSIVKKGLGAQSKIFLDKNNTKLPDRAIQLLNSNLMRMEGY